MHIATWGRPTRDRSSFWAVFFALVLRTVHTHKNCYFPASDQNYDIAIKFSDPDFLKENNNLAISRRFHAVTLTLTTWPWTYVVHRLLREQTLRGIEQCAAQLLMISQIFAVQLKGEWAFTSGRFSGVRGPAELYQIWRRLGQSSMLRPTSCFRFQISCSFSKGGRLKGEWCWI